MPTETNQSTDPFVQFKATQREGWALFAPLELITTPPAAQLVNFAGIRKDQKVLDVGCGTGVVAVTAARRGAKVTGLDLTPALLERARVNAQMADVAVEFIEGDAEKLPFADASFDAVLSQFGHMFAPRPDVAISEMLRVLKPGGTIAFSTWPPELFTGKMFSLVAQYLPPPPVPPAPPPQWGDPNIVRERLGKAVSQLVFHRDRLNTPGLSPRHLVVKYEETAAPVIKVVQALKDNPARLIEFRAAFEKVLEPYFRDNQIAQDYLMTRAVKN
jgi:SAM-dependent methyltransferase